MVMKKYPFLMVVFPSGLKRGTPPYLVPSRSFPPPPTRQPTILSSTEHWSRWWRTTPVERNRYTTCCYNQLIDLRTVIHLCMIMVGMHCFKFLTLLLMVACKFCSLLYIYTLQLSIHVYVGYITRCTCRSLEIYTSIAEMQGWLNHIE